MITSEGCRNDLKNRAFDEEGSQRFYSEQAGIAQGQAASENASFERRSKLSRTDPSTCFSVFTNSVLGVLRGAGLEVLLYPLTVTKIRQQCSTSRENCFQTVRRLSQEGGWKIFYRGLSPQLMKTTLKQAWIWPMVTHVPGFLGTYGFEKMQREVLTGLLIATIEAMMVPLEGMKIVGAFSGKSVLSKDHFRKRGWQGFGLYWAKHSVCMVSFLTAQEYLRNRQRKDQDSLTLCQLIKIGVQVACLVSFVSAPFDVANTLKQTQQLSKIQSPFSKQQICRLYRGFPLNTALLTAHSVASVILIESIKAKS